MSQAGTFEQLWRELKAEKRDVQFVILADGFADEIVRGVSTVRMPVMRDPRKEAWVQLDDNPVKHQTLIFDATGQEVYNWRPVGEGIILNLFKDTIGAEVRKRFPASP